MLLEGAATGGPGSVRPGDTVNAERLLSLGQCTSVSRYCVTTANRTIRRVGTKVEDCTVAVRSLSTAGGLGASLPTKLPKRPGAVTPFLVALAFAIPGHGGL